MGDARIRCCALGRAQQRIRALGWLTAAHAGLPRRTVIDSRLEDHRPYFQAALVVEPGGLGHDHRLPANDQRLALSSAPGWRRSQAASQMYGHLNGELLTVLSGLDWSDGAEYLLLLCHPCAALWRRASVSRLLIGLPLVLVTLLSASPSYRTLMYHYSLPLAVVAMLACISILRRQKQAQRGFPWTLRWAGGW